MLWLRGPLRWARDQERSGAPGHPDISPPSDSPWRLSVDARLRGSRLCRASGVRAIGHHRSSLCCERIRSSTRRDRRSRHIMSAQCRQTSGIGRGLTARPAAPTRRPGDRTALAPQYRSLLLTSLGGVVAAVAAVGAASGHVPGRCEIPDVTSRPPSASGKSTSPPFWHVHTYADRSAAVVASNAASTVVKAFGKVWALHDCAGTSPSPGRSTRSRPCSASRPDGPIVHGPLY